MTRFKKITWKESDKALLNRVRSCTGKWTTNCDEVKDLRSRLLDLQNWRCIYCQSLIEQDTNGHREVEHILPKNASKDCTDANGRSNDVSMRRSTLGYPSFTYEPLNLAVSCKQCNTLKGTHDPLSDRTQVRPLKSYPTAKELTWFHPQYSYYSKHISIDNNFIFTGKTNGGKSVIKECGLDRIEVLEAKFLARAKARARSANSVKLTVETLVNSVACFVFSLNDATTALSEKFTISKTEASYLMKLASNAITASQIEAFNMACDHYDRQHRMKKVN